MERSRDWMDQAEGDLRHARSDLEAGYYDCASFSAQQAAEKAVKAVFERAGASGWCEGYLLADSAANRLGPDRFPVSGGPRSTFRRAAGSFRARSLVSVW
jgi:hypothetical protein